MSSSGEESLADAHDEIKEEEPPISPVGSENQPPSRRRRRLNEDEDEEEPIRPNLKSKRSRRISNDEEESEDEESEGEEEAKKPARKRRGPNKRRRTVHDFIQHDVEVDDKDEDEDADFEEDDLALNPSERREVERALREQESTNRCPSHRDKLANMSEEELGRYFEARHVQESYASRAVNDEMFDSISQNSHLPTTKDPNLWMIRVRMGEEKLTTTTPKPTTTTPEPTTTTVLKTTQAPTTTTEEEPVYEDSTEIPDEEAVTNITDVNFASTVRLSIVAVAAIAFGSFIRVI